MSVAMVTAAMTTACILGWQLAICADTTFDTDLGGSCDLVMTFILQVHLCEVEDPQDLVSSDFPISVHKGHPLLVAVKILRPDATKNAR